MSAKKRIMMSDSEGSDYEMPEKKADDTKMEEVKKEPPPTPTPSKEDNGTSMKDDPTQSAKRKRKDDDEEDDDFAPDDKAEKDAEEEEEKEPPKKKQRKVKKEKDDEDDDFEEEKTPKKRKRAAKEKTPKKERASKKGKGKEKVKEEAEEGENGKKKKGRGKKVKNEEPEWKWWLDEKLPKGVKWRTLEHNGVVFPPEYEPHGVKMLYDGEPVDLPAELEEAATYYAQYLETDHVKKSAFNKNFFADFRALMKGTRLEKKITDFSKCDFWPINKYLIERKEAKKARTKEEKVAEKAEKEKILEKYGWALVDGHKQKVGNFRVEPPGLFLGRGAHPKTGHLKARIMPEDITINVGEAAPVPVCPLAGHKWGKVIHDNTVTWLAYWKESINGGSKYVWLSASSAIKGQADMKKFENARSLKKHIEKIRKTYMKEMKSKEKKIRQRATALWVIDHLALRVGNEKGSDEADTVGCCSLRIEHVNLHDDHVIEFDFLGKDSMRYQNKVKVPELVYKNFKLFMKNKKPSDDLFDHLTTTNLNAHLKSQMKGLTAKVFRTYNASITLQQELSKTIEKDATVHEKLLFYNRANKQVAILCNHQRSIPKKHDEQMDKLDKLIADLEDEEKLLKRRLKAVRKGKPLPEPKKKKVKKEEKEEGESKVKKEEKEKRLPSTEESIKRALEKLRTRIESKSTEKTAKEELKTIALGTSKINYLDPRITAAWCKREGVPIERIFSKSLRDKFPWAMDVDEDWEF